MSDAIIVALITAFASLVGIYITSKNTEKTILTEFKIHQAVTDEKIKALTEEVKKHNNFAQRVPVMETKIEQLEKAINHN